MSKEIIDLLEKIQSNLKLCLLHNHEEEQKYVDQALTLLKQQPTAGEFTKKIRSFVKMYENEIPKRAEITFLKEACDRLNRAEAINKDLLVELEKVNQCFKCKFGYRTSELTCPGHADAELPCAGFEEYYDSNLALEAVITKAKKVHKRDGTPSP